MSCKAGGKIDNGIVSGGHSFAIVRCIKKEGKYDQEDYSDFCSSGFNLWLCATVEIIGT